MRLTVSSVIIYSMVHVSAAGYLDLAVRNTGHHIVLTARPDT
jgi:hypothetical protein